VRHREGGQGIRCVFLRLVSPVDALVCMPSCDDPPHTHTHLSQQGIWHKTTPQIPGQDLQKQHWVDNSLKKVVGKMWLCPRWSEAAQKVFSLLWPLHPTADF